MFKHLSLLCLFAAILLPGCDEQAEEKAEIRQVFTDLEDFNNQRRGREILEVFSANSWAENEKLLRLAFDGTPEEIRKLGPGYRLEVFRIRVRGKRSELEKMDGRQFCQYATTAGWYVRPPEYRVREKLGRIEIKGDEAFADYIAEGKKLPIHLRFVREEGRWRYDEPYNMEQWDRFWYEDARDFGTPLEDLLIEWLEDELGRPVSRDLIWKPMRR